MSKNIKRDLKGCPILPGSNTFGNITRPKGGKRQPRNHDLKTRASERLVSLMTFGGERQAKSNDCRALRSHNEFAELSPFAKLTYYIGRVNDLYGELKTLCACGNERKIAFIEPAIVLQIDLMKNNMVEMYEVCKAEYGKDKVEEMLNGKD